MARNVALKYCDLAGALYLCYGMPCICHAYAMHSCLNGFDFVQTCFALSLLHRLHNAFLKAKNWHRIVRLLHGSSLTSPKIVCVGGHRIVDHAMSTAISKCCHHRKFKIILEVLSCKWAWNITKVIHKRTDWNLVNFLCVDFIKLIMLALIMKEVSVARPVSTASIEK